MGYVSNTLYHFVGRSLYDHEERYEMLAAMLSGNAGCLPNTDKWLLTGSFLKKSAQKMSQYNHCNAKVFWVTVCGGPERGDYFRQLRIDDNNVTLLPAQGKGQKFTVSVGNVKVKLPRELYGWHRPFTRDTFKVGLVALDAVSFCDIPEADLGRHMKVYKGFGLGFGKDFIMQNHGYPVHYISYDTNMGTPDLPIPLEEVVKGIYNQGRAISYDPSSACQHGADVERRHWNKFWKDLQRYFLSFVKPFKNACNPDALDNYYMEREWRVAGAILYTLEDVTKVIVPKGYRDRLLKDLPKIRGDIVVERDTGAPSCE